MFIGLLPKEADSHYAGKGVSLGAADRPIFWYRPKDSKTYRVVYADLSVRDADTPPSMSVVPPEQDLIDALRYYSAIVRGAFPDLAGRPGRCWARNVVSWIVVTKIYAKFPADVEQSPSAKQMQEMMKATRNIQPGLDFVASLPPQSDWHYAGWGVSLGAADRPIFWYRPKDSKKYRVIYADLSVRDADTAPDVPGGPPQQDLIDALRYYSELSDGTFPDSLDRKEFFQSRGKKFGQYVGQAHCEAGEGMCGTRAEASARRGVCSVTAPGSRRALRGQRRRARQGRHAHLLVPPQGRQEVPGRLRRSFGP